MTRRPCALPPGCRRRWKNPSHTQDDLFEHLDALLQLREVRPPGCKLGGEISWACGAGRGVIVDPEQLH